MSSFKSCSGHFTYSVFLFSSLIENYLADGGTRTHEAFAMVYKTIPIATKGRRHKPHNSAKTIYYIILKLLLNMLLTNNN